MNTFRALRNRLGLTQDALAKGIGVSQGNVAHYEKGQTVPPDVARRLIVLAKERGHSISFDDVYAEPEPESVGCDASDEEKIRESKGPMGRRPADVTKLT